MITFEEALNQHNLHPKSVIADGKLHRFDSEKKGKRNGWYVFHGDHGAFGDWGTGLKKGWRDGNAAEITPEERKAQKEAQRARIAEKKKQYQEAAVKAQELWQSGVLASDEHPYLKKKSVRSHYLRVLGDKLLIPARDETGAIVNVQTIDANGTKLWQKGANTIGVYYSFGKVKDNKLYIGEGYATCATMYEVTGHAVVCAFNKDNLGNVTQILRRKFPAYDLTIIADNDQGKKRHDGTEFNPGLEAALKASEYGADVIMPDFTPEEGASKQTDLNDYARAHSEEEVREVMSKPVKRGVDYHSPLPHTKNEGRKPMNTIENLEEICKRLGFTIRFNAITRKHEVMRPGMSYISDEFDNAALARLNSECERFGYPTSKVDQYITEIGSQNAYNPVVNWILSKPWDGESRKLQLFETVQSANTHLQHILMYRWFLQCIGAAFEPEGVAAQGVLVFQGAQDLGKTTWLLNLVPPEMSTLVKDGVILRLDDKDSIIQCIRYWIVELGELEATFKRSDIAQMKAFITSQKDIIRVQYARRASEYPRRTSFFASVNLEEFLHDSTGNRRFWTIKCEKINAFHGIDMQQFWREIYEDYREGERWFLTPEEKELLNDNNKEFESGDMIQDKIIATFNWDELSTASDWLMPTQICEEIGVMKPTLSEVKRAATVVRQLNGNKQERRAAGKFLLVPRKKVAAQTLTDRMMA